MYVWNVLHAAHWNTGRKKSPSANHRTTLSGCIFATKAYIDILEKLVKRQYFLHISSQLYAELRPINGWDLLASLGHPANFNGFRVLASLLHRRRSTEVNQALHDVWPFPGLVHYVYILGGSCPVTEFCQVQNSFCVQVLRYPILAALLRDTRAVSRQPNFADWYPHGTGGHAVRR